MLCHSVPWKTAFIAGWTSFSKIASALGEGSLLWSLFALWCSCSAVFSWLTAELTPVSWPSLVHQVSLVHTKIKTALFKCMYLGEDGAGKTSLIRRIQGIEEYKKGRGLEYLYLNVHDEDRDGECGLPKSTRRDSAGPHCSCVLSSLSSLSRSSRMSWVSE